MEYNPCGARGLVYRAYLRAAPPGEGSKGFAARRIATGLRGRISAGTEDDPSAIDSLSRERLYRAAGMQWDIMCERERERDI